MAESIPHILNLEEHAEYSYMVAAVAHVVDLSRSCRNQQQTS